MRYRCPVCFFDKLPYPPADYHICPCCGTEFGNDDAEFSHQQLREMWIGGGANWFFGGSPPNWNPWLQILGASIGFANYLPANFLDVSFRSKGTHGPVSVTRFVAEPALRVAA